MVKMTWKLVAMIVIGLAIILLGFSGFKEGFQAGLPGRRCGVDLPTCPMDLQCMNGFCEKPSAPPLLKNQLPVYP